MRSIRRWSCFAAFLVSLPAALLPSGCANHSVSVTPPPRLSPAVGLDPARPIAVVVPAVPPAFAYEKSSGRLGTAGDGAVRGIQALAPKGNVDAGAAFVLVALVPVAAVVGAVVETGRTAPAGELQEAEANLSTGFAVLVAKQHELRTRFLDSAREQTRLRFIAVNEPPPAGWVDPAWRHLGPGGFDHVLELSLKELNLQRTGLTDATYALVMKAGVRLVRPADAGIVYDETVQFRSGEGLFVNWTHNQGEPLRKVAESGFQTMADEIVRRVFAAHLATKPGGGRDFARPATIEPTTPMPPPSGTIYSHEDPVPSRAAVRREHALAVDTPFPNFVLEDLDGRPLDLAGLRGRVVLVIFWSAASRQLVAELPALRDAYRLHRDRGFEIVGINVDAGRFDAAEFVKIHALPWTQCRADRGPDRGLADKLGIVFTPASYLLDRDGTIVARHVRAADLDGTVRRLLARKPE